MGYFPIFVAFLLSILTFSRSRHRFLLEEQHRFDFRLLIILVVAAAIIVPTFSLER